MNRVLPALLTAALFGLCAHYAYGQAVPDPTGNRPTQTVCGPARPINVGVGNTALVVNDGGSNRVFLCSAMFNLPVTGSFALFEGPTGNNCAVDAGTQTSQRQIVCGLSNDGGTCVFNAGGGFILSGQGPAVSTQVPGDDLCISTDAGVAGYYSTKFAP